MTKFKFKFDNPKRLFFTSDTHFGHSNIIRFSNRPFSTVGEMDDVLIDNINAAVGRDDILFHLGDWSWPDPVPYRRRIACENIYFVYGNHDDKRMDFRRTGDMFRWHGTKLEIDVNGQYIVMDHYAHLVWNKSHHGSWHLYGHSHGSLPDNPVSLSFDCGVDCTEYKPLSYDEVAARMAAKTFLPIDHHGARPFETVNKVTRY